MKSDESKEPTPTTSAPAPLPKPAAVEPERVRLEDLAKAADLLPQNLATGSPSRPVSQNPKFWLYRAICVRYRWDEHSLITKSEFDAAIAAVSHFSV